MRLLFWVGSVLAPLLGGLGGFIGIAAVLAASDGEPGAAAALMFIPMGLGMLWFVIANMLALFRVLTDPGNDRKLVWFLGWAFANLFMHIAFIYVYVVRSEPRSEGVTEGAITRL